MTQVQLNNALKKNRLCITDPEVEVVKTGRRWTDEAIEKERGQIETILSSVGTGLCLINPDMSITKADKKIRTMFPHAEPIGQLCHAFYASSETPCLKCPAIRTFKTGEIHEIDRFNPSNGRWYHIISQPTTNKSDRTANVLLGITDITDRKKTEDELRVSEERFRQMAESIRDIFWIYSIEKKQFLYISPAYESVFGKTCQSLYDNPSSFADVIHPDDRNRIISSREKQIKGDYKEEYRILHPDRSVRWIRDRAFPVRDESDKVYRIVGIAQDITEEKMLRQESEYRLQQVLQADKLASLGEVVAGVAHEINNPNSFIAYNIPLLEETWQVFEPILADYATRHPDNGVNNISLNELCNDMKDIIQSIKIGSDRINKVVTNLKDFARMDESVHTKPVNINEVIEKTLTIIGAQLRKSASKLEVNLADNLPEIQGHFQKLEQVVANLLVNAAHVIPVKEEGKIFIRSRYVERLQSVLIEVEDNGTGIEPSDIDRIFEPFFTTHRETGGTGLGLSVSYGLVKEHHGIIGVLSRPGKGSRFSVFLPIHREATLDIKPSILCVDDDVQFPSMLKTYFLKVENKSFEAVDNPGGAVAYLEEHPEVDIVLCDVVMPGINGWEVLEKIKARFPLVTFILYSGCPEALQRKESHTYMPDYVLQKPFNMKDLVEITGTLGRQRL